MWPVGTITLHHGTPTSVDMALMFLYRKTPKLNNNNIEDMLDMAEFFLIPNLKAVCYRWLRKQSVTEDTCLSWIQLSTKYGFSLELCTAYLESHLIEVLRQPLSITLTFESVECILSKKKFIYLPMEDRLRFVIRWYLAQPEERKEQTEQLVEWITFNEISESCLNDVKCNPSVDVLLRDMHGANCDGDELIEVLIHKQDRTLFCYDISRDIWFQIELVFITDNDDEIPDIADTIPDASELYCETSYKPHGIHVYNFSFLTGETKKYKVVTDTGEPVHRLGRFKFTGTVPLYVSEHVQTKSGNITKMSKEDNYSHRPIKLRVWGVSATRTYLTTVHIGQWVDEEIQMRPMLSLSDFHVASITANNNSVVAMIPTSKDCIVLYDTINCTIDKVQQETKDDDKIVPDQDGFLIHNKERCITIQRKSGPGLSERYDVKEIALIDDTFRNYDVCYFYCNNEWFRIAQNYRLFQFQCVEHSKLQEAPSPSDVAWKELTLPKKRSSYPFYKKLHFLRLPKRLLVCPVDCIHCTAKTQTPTAVYDDDSDDSFGDIDDSIIYCFG